MKFYLLHVPLGKAESVQVFLAVASHFYPTMHIRASNVLITHMFS